MLPNKPFQERLLLLAVRASLAPEERDDRARLLASRSFRKVVIEEVGARMNTMRLIMTYPRLDFGNKGDASLYLKGKLFHERKPRIEAFLHHAAHRSLADDLAFEGVGEIEHQRSRPWSCRPCPRWTRAAAGPFPSHSTCTDGSPRSGGPPASGPRRCPSA